MLDTAKGTAAAESIRARIGGNWRDAETVQEVRNPYRDETVARSPISTKEDCDDALAAAHDAKDVMSAMPGYERAALLHRAADILATRTDDIGRAMARESGKALRDSVLEAQVSVKILRLCAEEAVRIQGEHVPMDGNALGAGKIAMLMRFPVGVVAGILPRTSVACHKRTGTYRGQQHPQASPKAPLCAIFSSKRSSRPAHRRAQSTVYGDTIAPQLVTDPRVDFVSSPAQSASARSSATRSA
jgi:hypothetical protein